jgi:hypothetical protein
MKSYIEEMISDHEDYIGGRVKDYVTPAKPQSVLMKNEGAPIDESEYRRVVGKALFAVRKVLPDCGNVIRECSSHLSNPGEDQWKTVGRMMGHLKFHQQPLKLRTPEELRVIAYSDSDWATDKNDRKSICSHLITIGGSLVHWQTKKQAGIALSSTEAELIAASVAAADVKFENMLLSEMVGKRLLLPSKLHVDNTGAMHIANNGAVGPRTKHIDIRDRFVTEMTTTGELEVVYIKTDDNPADVTSKNCKESTHLKHASNIYNGVFPSLSREDVASNARDCSKDACKSQTGSEKRIGEDDGRSEWIPVSRKRTNKNHRDYNEISDKDLDRDDRKTRLSTRMMRESKLSQGSL